MADVLTFSQLGMILGGAALGVGAGAFFLIRHFAKPGKRKDVTGEHGPVVRRDEFTVTMAGLQVRIEESHKIAAEAKAAALATQHSLTAIGNMIEASMSSLGDRLEQALGDMKARVQSHDKDINEHHGRLRSVETELEIRREH